MNEILTLAEIEARYDSEWVLVGNPELDKDLRLIRGEVLFHSKSRDEIDVKDAELGPESAAIIYTGRIPEGTAVVLGAHSSMPSCRSGHRPDVRVSGYQEVSGR